MILATSFGLSAKDANTREAVAIKNEKLSDKEIVDRVKEIQNMSFKNLPKEQKRELRKELMEMKKTMPIDGIYIGGTALVIIIILLLVLLL